MRQKKTKLLFLCLLLAAAAMSWRLMASQAVKNQTKYVTTDLKRGVVTSRIAASGSLSPNVTVQIGAQVSGSIQALFADFNSVVKKGQVIARLDQKLFVAMVEQAQANLMASEGALKRQQTQAADLERQARRAEDLSKKGIISQAERDTVRANADSMLASIDAALGGVAQAKASLHQAEINLGYTTIVSPINGTVISRNMDVGQTVAATMTAPVLFVIAEDMHKMQIHTAVPESDVANLQSGMPVVFTVDAYPRVIFQGMLAEIHLAPHMEQNVVTYDAIVTVDNSDMRLKPGMTANVSFILAQSPESFVVPNAALNYLPEPSETQLPEKEAKTAQLSAAVWVLRANTPMRIEVKPKVTDGAFTAVFAGDLIEGDQLITDTVVTKADAPFQILRF